MEERLVRRITGLSLLLLATCVWPLAATAQEPPWQINTLSPAPDKAKTPVLFHLGGLENHRGELSRAALYFVCLKDRAARKYPFSVTLALWEEPVSFFKGTSPPYRVLFTHQGSPAISMQLWREVEGSAFMGVFDHALRLDSGINPLMQAMLDTGSLVLHIKDSGDSVGRMHLDLESFPPLVADLRASCGQNPESPQ